MNHLATPAASALSAAQSSPTCPRCTGSGYLPQFRHVEHGRCFRCGGSGRVGR